MERDEREPRRREPARRAPRGQQKISAPSWNPRRPRTSTKGAAARLPVPPERPRPPPNAQVDGLPPRREQAQRVLVLFAVALVLQMLATRSGADEYEGVRPSPPQSPRPKAARGVARRRQARRALPPPRSLAALRTRLLSISSTTSDEEASK